MWIRISTKRIVSIKYEYIHIKKYILLDNCQTFSSLMSNRPIRLLFHDSKLHKYMGFFPPQVAYKAFFLIIDDASQYKV